MSFSVVIPSKNRTNLKACIQAIRAAGETCRIIVVDDSDDARALDMQNRRGRVVHVPVPSRDFARDYEPVQWVEGVRPFIFARNVNLGIQAAGTDDVIVLNDDALLKVTLGFGALQAAACGHPELGVIASACDTVGNPNQFRQPPFPGRSLRFEVRMVCFVCVYIPRATIDVVGLLDERFVDYGMDDDDYCLRVRSAGLKLGIFDGCYVDHGSLTSSYRGGATTGGDFRPNMRRFIEKWGVDNFGRDKAHSEWAALWP